MKFFYVNSFPYLLLVVKVTKMWRKVVSRQMRRDSSEKTQQIIKNDQLFSVHSLRISSSKNIKGCYIISQYSSITTQSWVSHKYFKTTALYFMVFHPGIESRKKNQFVLIYHYFTSSSRSQYKTEDLGFKLQAQACNL